MVPEVALARLRVERQPAVQGPADVLRLPEAVLLAREQQVGARYAFSFSAATIASAGSGGTTNVLAGYI
jgi:hypothetical protein